ATLAALVIFNQLPLDYIILEVGLGGRLDAVNIVDADCAAVTSIDLDHMDWLGDDREQIGREKAGVFREDKPAVCGATNTPASIAQVAQEVGANLYQVGEQFSYDSDGDHWDWHGVDAKGQGLTINDIPMPQLPHANALTALQILALMAPDAPAHVLRAAIAEAQVEGRMQKVAPKTLVDVAHNPEAARYLAARITKLGKPVHLVIGMLADKDCASVLETLVPVVKHVYLASLDVPRGQTSEELAQAMPQSSVKPPLHSCFATVPQAIEAATKARQKGERVYIVGSFFTVAQALDYFNYEG
ncbi:MAG: bifunctional folylpolyglutamate synthase/dihydrofolate synthase, partial [Pontibacterium sp.]